LDEVNVTPKPAKNLRSQMPLESILIFGEGVLMVFSEFIFHAKEFFSGIISHL
jgi:hypothetical protein